MQKKFFISKRESKKGVYYALGCDTGISSVILSFDTNAIYTISGLTMEAFASLKVDEKYYLN